MIDKTEKPISKKLLEPPCPCPSKDCTSSDGFHIYEKSFSGGRKVIDGWCYSCRTFSGDPYGELICSTGESVSDVRHTNESPIPVSGPVHTLASTPAPSTEYPGKLSVEDGLSHPIRGICDRGISYSTAQYFGVRIGVSSKDGETPIYTLFPRYRDETLVGWKTKTNDKKFLSSGGTETDLFGSHLCKPQGKKLYITEGEIDCLSLFQAVKENSSYDDYNPNVVSLSDGCSSALKSLSSSALVDAYDELVLVFDNDSAGKQARDEVCKAYAGKVSYVTIPSPYKDANDMVIAGKSVELKWLVLTGAKKYHPDGLVRAKDLRAELSSAEKSAMFSYPDSMPILNEKTYGPRLGTIVTITSGSGCVDKDTEFLTPTGWKRISEYEEGDKVMQYSHEGQSSFVTPTEYIKLPCSKLTHIKTKYGLDMALSDEHLMAYCPEDSEKLRTVRVSDVEDFTQFRGRIPTTFSYDGSGEGMSGKELDELRLHVAVSADSHLPKKQAIFRLKKVRKIERLEALLCRLGLVYKVRLCSSTGFTVITIPYSKPKGFPVEWYELPAIAKRVIAEESLYWDGDQKKSFYSCNKSEADFIQYCFASTGTKATILLDVRDGRNTCYQVCTTDRTLVGMRYSQQPSVFCPEDGYKYCFVVPNSYLVLRREGKIFITHNSGKTSFIKELMYWLLMSTEEKIAGLFLEEDKAETIKSLISLHLMKRIHLPDVKVTEEELNEAFDTLYDSDRIGLYDFFGGMDDSSLLSKLRYYALTGHKFIFLDHLSLVISEFATEGDERKRIDVLMTKLAKFVKQYNVCLFLVVHLRKGDTSNVSFEMGAVPTLDDLRGSAALKQLSWDVLGASRNQQHRNPYCANTTELTVLKCRFTGRTGTADYLHYNGDTGRMMNVEKPMDYREVRKIRSF